MAAEVTAKVRTNLRPLQKYLKLLSVGGQSAHNEVLLRWLVRYKKRMQTRFNVNARGGGAWPRLKTPIRKRVKKRSRQILIDSGTIREAMEPVPNLKRFPRPGAETKRIRGGISVGFGGGALHPFSKMTIAKLIFIHHKGRGNVPVRRIILPPDASIQRLMVQDLKDVANATKRRLGMT